MCIEGGVVKYRLLGVAAVLRLLVTCLVVVSAPLHAQKKGMTLPAKDTITNWLNNNKVPAVGIGLIENGKIKQARVFGELREGVLARDNTMFNVASLTKPIVAVLILKLVSMGRWNLDEPLSNYF